MFVRDGRINAALILLVHERQQYFVTRIMEHIASPLKLESEDRSRDRTSPLEIEICFQAQEALLPLVPFFIRGY